MTGIAANVLHELEKLSGRDQQRALELVRGLSERTSRRPKGTPIQTLLDMAGTLDDQSADEMRRAIEDACEQIDPEDWH